MFDCQDLQQPPASTTETSQGYPQTSGAQPVHALDRLTAIFRHRRIAGAAFAIVLGLMMLHTYSKVPLYRTSARVLIQDERTTAVGNLNANDPAFWQDSDQYYNTQYSIRRSRGRAEGGAPRLRRPHPPLL